jgi:hypothetical protein
MFPVSSFEAIELLDSMLQFDPNDRVDPEIALSHSYFDSIKTQGYVSGHPNMASSSDETSKEDFRNSFSSDSVSCDGFLSQNLKYHSEKVKESALNIRRNVSRIYIYYLTTFLTV